MKKLLVAFSCLMITTGGITASEQKPVTAIDDLPNEVILNEIVPNLDDQSLLNLTKSSKKYHELFKDELKMRERVRTFSEELLQAIVKNPKELKSLLEGDEILKTLNLAPEWLTEYAEIELERKNMLKQREKFKEEMLTSLNPKKFALVLSFSVLYQGIFNTPEFENLEDLLISNNYNLKVLDKNVFKGLKKLKKLEIFRNNLTNLDPALFKGLENLTELSLSSNKLTNLDPALFKELKNLTTLNLESNKLTNLDPALFKELNNLTTLNLSGNLLTNLDPALFKELKNLERLDLSGNPLINLYPAMFKELKNLTTLKLASNKLTNLDPAWFEGLENLTSLDLRSNNLTSLDPALFNELKNLKTLTLTSNKLTYLDPALFTKLKNFKMLYIGDHRLSDENIKELKKVINYVCAF